LRWLALVIGCVACTETPGQTTQAQAPFTVTLLARRDGGKPVPGAKVLHGKAVIGTTDAQGAANLALQGAEGDTVSLSVKCPEGFASPEKPIQLGLRRLLPGSPQPKFEAECMALVRTIVVGIRADKGPHLPIVRLNQVVGETDSHGAAHVELQASVNEQVALTLKTNDYPGLRPQNPILSFVVQDRDEMVLLEQKFTPPKKVIVRAPPKMIPRPI
jgi:hypothetical protein